MTDHKFATISIIGEPNAGKSTLLNRLVGENISIVTHKVQTTRRAIRGILTENNTQLAFIDTPGIFKPKAASKLERNIVRNATNALAEADLVCLMLDAKRPFSAETQMIIEMLASKQDERPLVAILNKVDSMSKEELLPPAQKLTELSIFSVIAMISAKTGVGVKQLIQDLCKLAPNGAWQYSPEELTDASMRSICEDITRAELYLHLHKEMPYSLTVSTEEWKPDQGEGIIIKQVILVNKTSQKKIALGRAGQMIKLVSRRAREKISRLLGQKIHLYLYVKVQEDWVESMI